MMCKTRCELMCYNLAIDLKWIALTQNRKTQQQHHFPEIKTNIVNPHIFDGGMFCYGNSGVFFLPQDLINR